MQFGTRRPAGWCRAAQLVEEKITVRYYLAQLGGVWSVTPKALRRLCAEGIATGGHSLDGPGIRQLLVPFSEASLARREGLLPKRWQTRDVVLLRPLDWTREQYQRALDAIDAGDIDALRNGV